DPYAFYVEFSETSDNIVMYFMGGGGCWDYDSCVGGGARGAANPGGLPDDYANVHLTFPLGDTELAINVNQVYPLLNNDPEVSPMADWNKVFVPYCTGDVYSGSITNTYQDPDGIEPDEVFAHVGHTNVVKMTEMLNDMFGAAPEKKLFVGGCSAGGAGAIVNYYFLRTGIDGVQQGYLLNDSGPIYPSTAPTSRSRFLHDEVRSVWDADSLIAKAPQSEALTADFGALSRVLSEEFPNDRLAATFFRLDYNFSLYSYERFWTLDQDKVLVEFEGDGLGLDEDVSADRTGIHTAWWDDAALLRAQYDAPGRDNLGYFIPYWRQTNDSHCVTIPGLEENPPLVLLDNFAELAWDGTEIDTDDGEMTIHDYAVHLLSDEPLKSYFEPDEASEGPYRFCTPSVDFDEAKCEAAVNPPAP
ncbi:MAG: hypothetical protein JRG70_19670, partial [Deltaproteobacteria bacterium]|nr:hypothetical protein [Deltaproteobacteria bacterium]